MTESRWRLPDQEVFLKQTDGGEFCVLKRGRKMWMYAAADGDYGNYRSVILNGPENLRQLAEAILEALPKERKGRS